MAPLISPLDPTDTETVDAVHALQVAVDAADVPDFPEPCRLGFQAELTHPVSSRRVERYVAVRGGAVAGYLSLNLPQRENLENAEVTLCVHPEHRRHGVGRALHAYLLGRLRELGRKRFYTDAVAALPGGPTRHGAGGAFAAAVGAEPALEEVRRRLDLTALDEPALDELLASARAKATGYQLVTWEGPAPDEFAAGVAYLDARLTSDAPMGDLQWEAPQPDVARLREGERALYAGRPRVYSAGAVHEQTGRLVALTVFSRTHTTPWHAFQWVTLVDPPHRGHRLGTLVKVANLRFAQSREPALRAVDTWNAAVNQHMIAINEAMGFRPVDRWVNWQQEV